VQLTSVAGVHAAGESTGVGGMPLALAEGENAGRSAAGATVPAALRARRDRERAHAAALDRAFALRGELATLATPETIVCRCEDVPCSAIRSEWSSREAKLLTRAGMGPCQGRICGPALEALYGWPRDRVRPPIEPVLLSTMIHDTALRDAHRDTPHLSAT
jgi:hypothetical protein